MPNPLRSAGLLYLAVVTLVAPGCGRRLQSTLGPANRPPVLRLEGTTSPAGVGGDISAHLRWSASDPDGRVDHYLVSTDITRLGQESAWSVTGENERGLQFRRAERGAATPSSPARPGFGFIAVRAVDDRGALSEPQYRAFFDENIAPTVSITQPPIGSPIEWDPYVPPSFWVRWEGSDPDGPNGRPERYKYKLFQRTPSTPIGQWLSDPDSLRRQFAPTFPGWDSISGDSTRLRLTDLTPNSEYLFVITALDAEGAYDPVFHRAKNVLRFIVSKSSLGPRITLFNESFYFQYGSGGFPAPLDSSWFVRIQAPAQEPLTLNWYALPPPQNLLAGYRWALDIADVYDETPRTGKHDLSHWSPWDLTCTSATVGPFHGAALDVPHRLYVEAADDNGLTSLAVVQFRLVRPAFDRDLLVVDDTRLAVDQIVAGRPDTLRSPTGRWPSAAELDTFLFATGGVRWRMTPAGTLSPPGLFKGYRFDTLGTRRGLVDPTIPLDVLGRYRHVIWMVDGPAVEFTGSPASLTTPITTLRYMSGPNRLNTLAAWLRGGGKLWALGGGFGHATNTPWNNLMNDSAQTRTYSSIGTRPDLTPGRFMYDLAHWRSEFRYYQPAPATVTRAPFASAGRAAADGYALLPALLRTKSPATDPLPPRRIMSDFYLNTRDVSLECLSLPDAILEDKNPSARHQNEVQALDTLMVATGAQLPAPGADPAVDRVVNPVMTLYHGADCGPVVFTGFDIWSWSRADCASLVDAVLQGIWHLQRDAVTGAGSTAARRPGPVATPASRPGRD